MDLGQKIAALFGRHYVLYARDPQHLEVRRVFNVNGYYYIRHLHQGESGDQYILTKESLAPSPMHLGVLMSTLRNTMHSDPIALPATYRWAGLTRGLEGIICMMPDEDDFRPRINIDPGSVQSNTQQAIQRVKARQTVDLIAEHLPPTCPGEA